MAILAGGKRGLRAPWPAHARLAGMDIPLAYQDKAGTSLVADVPPDQASVAPAEYGEQSRNPEFGGTMAIRDLTRGFGRRHQFGQPTGHYWYTINGRVRAGRWIPGPAITSYTPATRDSTNGVTRFFEIGGHIYAVDGRYVLDGSTDGTGWTVSKDTGSGKVATDVIVAQSNASGSTRYVWLGMGDAEPMHYFDGSSWTQTSGANTMYARAFALDANNLYRFDDANRMWQIDLNLDPRSLADWASATDRIGSKDWGVTRATVNSAGSLVICKADDIYTLNTDGTVNRLFQQKQFVPATTNGEALGVWRNDLYVTYAGASYRLTEDGGLTQVGPELLTDNGSEVKGYITAWLGTDFFALAGLYNPDTGKSYLMEFTGEVVPDEFGRAEPVWHGSISPAFASKKITALHQSTLGATSGHRMAYIGFSDGTIAKYQLACTPDPSDCSSETYSTSTAAEIYLSRLAFGFPSLRKGLLEATLEADQLSSEQPADLFFRTRDWQTDITGAGNTNVYQKLASYNNSLQFVHTPTQTFSFHDDQTCAWLDPFVRMTTTSSTTPAIVTGLSLVYQVRVPPQKRSQIVIPLRPGYRKRDGTPYRLSPQDYVTRIDGLTRSGDGQTFLDPDTGAEKSVSVVLARETVGYEAESRAAVKGLAVLLVDRHQTAVSSSPITGSYAWYKADSGTGQTLSTSPVSTWADQSGNGRDLTSSGSARPQYLISQTNGLPAVVFDGTDDYMRVTGLTTTSQPCELWLVMAVTGSGGGSYPIVTLGGTGAVPTDYLSLILPNGAFRLAWVGGSSLIYGDLLNQWMTLRIVYDGTNSVAYVDNSIIRVDYSVPIYTLGRGIGSSIVLGSDAGLGGFTPCAIGEMLVYDRRLTEAEAAVQWGYLQRWATF